MAVEMKAKDFKKTDDCEYESKLSVWGEEVEMDVDSEDSSLKKMLPLINKIVGFLDDNRGAVAAAMIDDGMLELAEEWVESAEEAEDSTDDRKGYIVDNDTVVYLPISEEDFTASLHVEGISIYFDDEEEAVCAEVFLYCSPDYFAGHSIEFSVDSKGNFEIEGLAG